MQKERNSTKQRILIEALTLFSVKGYQSVTVAAIAKAVGIKAPSLYKHYKSKQDIFAAILAEMKNRYEKQAASMQINGVEADKDQRQFMRMGEEELIALGKGLFLYFLHDEYMSKFRKMLTVEQYNSNELAALYAKQYGDDPIFYQSMLFGQLAEADLFISENAQIMSLHFYAPIFFLLNLCDCQREREEAALEMLEQHIRQFNRLYRKEQLDHEDKK